jgi:Domain of unknown function (DUF4274)
VSPVNIEKYVTDDSPYRSYQKAYAAMIEWLSGKPQDVWVFATQHNNWSYGVAVLRWMVNQPDCDIAVAAQAFWMSNPSELAQRDKNRFNDDMSKWDEADLLVLEIAQKAELERFVVSKLGPIDLTDTISIEVERINFISESDRYGAPIPRFPENLINGFGSKRPRLRDIDHPEKSQHVWDLFAALGVKHGKRPYSTGASEARLEIIKEFNEMANKFRNLERMIVLVEGNNTETESLGLENVQLLRQRFEESGKRVFDIEKNIDEMKFENKDLVELISVCTDGGKLLQNVIDLCSVTQDASLRFCMQYNAPNP